MKMPRDFMRFYLVPLVLLAGILITAAFTLFYTSTTQTENGAIVSTHWPKDFTLEFAENITVSSGKAEITDAGKAQLDENGLWFQLLDAAGTEILNYKKPADMPKAYQPYALLQLFQEGSGEYSVFVGSIKAEGAPYTYLIGFPLTVTKSVMYVDTARYHSGRILIVAVLLLTALLVITLTVYSYKTFSAAKTRREQDAKAKEEWLANITHDLKTPLAPIRGYAELLAEEKNPATEKARRYGGIILKNALYTEELVDDLKLAYQLQSDMLPLKPETRNITAFIREILIDILNAPEYEERDIEFSATRENINGACDPQLFRRALTNILINAVKHNTAETKIRVHIEAEGQSDIKITVADNGSGMTPTELEGLFQRYYRGTDTATKAEGSGLGMAIAKQIIEAHGGKIQAQSHAGVGTTVTIQLPRDLRIK